jgi:hypothetical protein
MRSAYTALLLFITLSCVRQEENGLLRAMETMISKKLSSEYKAIVIVPSSGCGGCINGAEEFLVNDYIYNGKTGIFFIVTGHTSRKSARIRLGDALDHKDVYFDFDQKFSKPPFLTQFPKVVFIEHEAIQKEEEINPETGEQIYFELSTL